VVLDFGFCGLTRLYASPEVLDGQPPTPVDDVYSLAALVYRLTTGNWPYGNLDASEAALSGARPARPSTMAPDQWQTLQQGLAPRRSARFQTVADFVAAYTSRPDPLPARGIGAATTMALLAGLGVLAWQALPYWKSEMEGRAAGVARSAERAPALALNAPTPAPPPVAAPLPAPVSVPVTVPLAVPLIPEQAPVTVPPAAPAGPPRIYLSPTGQLVVSESDPYVRLRVRGAGLREPVTVGVEARSGSAEMNQDFVPPPASVRLTPRHSTAEILVSLIGDDRKENVEDFGVELSVADGNAALATRSAVVILTDDD
jgi:serine/threonine protein kinase